jgi:hypothetical protein
MNTRKDRCDLHMRPTFNVLLVESVYHGALFIIRHANLVKLVSIEDNWEIWGTMR